MCVLVSNRGKIKSGGSRIFYSKMGCASGDGGFDATEILCHTAMFIETIAFVQKDIFRLRLIETMAALLLFIFAIIKHKETAYKDCHAIWSFTHVVVNVYRMVKSKAREARVMSELSPEEEVIRKEFFPNYSVAHFVELREKWTFKHHSRGDMILHEGEDVKKLSLVYSGECSVTANDVPVAIVGPGQYIGEMAFFTREPASASLWANNNVVLIQWDLEEVRDLSVSVKRDHQSQAFAMLPAQFCKDLTQKLIGVNKVSSSLAINHEDGDVDKDGESREAEAVKPKKSGNNILKKNTSKIKPIALAAMATSTAQPKRNMNLPKHLQNNSAATNAVSGNIVVVGGQEHKKKRLSRLL